MTVRNHEDLRRRYAAQYGVAAGYLPSNFDGVAEWQTRLIAELAAADSPDSEHPSVAAVRELIDSDRRVRALVNGMLEQSKGLHQYGNVPIKTVDMMLAMMNHIVVRAPAFNPDSSKRNAFPMSALFAYMMYTEAGTLVFANEKFNDAIRGVLQAWCDYLDSPASRNVINKGEDGWLSPAAALLMNLKDFIIPDPGDEHGGFASWNAYFHRHVKLEARQLAGADDPKVIVSANDGTIFRITRHAQREAEFWTKDQPYSLENMLDGKFVGEFVDGDVFQSFLSGDNYHHWHAPVAGTVIKTKVVDGLQFEEVHAVATETSTGVNSLSYEASVNTRGLVFIQADDSTIGLVCVMPIGITEISSVTIRPDLTEGVDEGKPVHVDKGDNLGYFSYGGSTLCVIFQPGAIKSFRWTWPPADPDSPPTINVRDWIALAN